ncbi:FecCD family ABC transporter permease [Dactylosporangium matsuzakiense]|uniref:ABC transporter permease n=1 Tax=Dactylosporangium matsuzakiense TaxID=53360 RepID=A0A9W6KE04_9ACTN|nr:iron chelate uptake ABC transporter family permease subunit [Dactylosporangium matsuzakiense]UWZ47240.1 iron chelate uptake ABC transporter family permease subunit [Dactylosporangium matsuzakiense]GLK98309.1 ABC transporter permease [Dactylosporangium matsuzakiense]
MSRRAFWVSLALAAVAVLAALVAIGSGDYPMGLGDVVRTLAGGGTPADAFIVRALRLPRVVTALVTGGALALAGALFQSLVRNPLGSPDVLGFTQGSATGGLLAVVVSGGGTAAVAGGSLLGAAATGVAIYLLAWRGGGHGHRLILVGIGVAGILTGVNSYLLIRANIVDAARAVLWLTGSLDGRGWGSAAVAGGALVLLTPVVAVLARALANLELGDDLARGLGVGVGPVRAVALACAVLLAAAAAAAAGPVLFVALTAPQLARRLTGVAGPNLLPSLFMGAALLTGADVLAQRLLPGRQLPVGVVTGLLGGGYLILLLARTARRARV